MQLVLALVMVAFGVVVGVLVAQAVQRRLFSERLRYLDQKHKARVAEVVHDHRAQLAALKEQQHEEVARVRRDSLSQRRDSLRGLLSEQMAPLLRGFPYDPSDARFLGDPVEYVVFHGHTLRRAQGRGEVELIVVDLKQGDVPMTEAQQAIAEAIAAGRVRFEVVRVADDGSLLRRTWRPHHAVEESLTPPAPPSHEDTLLQLLVADLEANDTSRLERARQQLRSQPHDGKPGNALLRALLADLDQGDAPPDAPAT